MIPIRKQHHLANCTFKVIIKTISKFCDGGSLYEVGNVVPADEVF